MNPPRDSLYKDYLAKKDRLAKAKNYLEYFKKTHGHEEFPYWQAFHQAVQDEKDAWAAFNSSLDPIHRSS